MSLVFNPSVHYVIDSNTPKVPYRRRTGEEKTAVHWGQRKLFLTVLQFMTYYVDLGTPDLPRNPKIVYAGAAPGHNIALLSKLFPTCEFHLYDTNKFSDLLNNNPKVTLYNQYFLDKDAERWKNTPDVYFISDIRRDTVGMTTRQAEETIIGDMMMQQRWYEIMQPVHAHLKFHLPYTGLGLEPTLEYLNGTVYVQPWRGPTSTECRLVPKRGYKKVWNNIDYEQQNFYINTVLREGKNFLNPLTGNNEDIDGNELYNDYDGCLEICILMDYLKRFSPDYANHVNLAINLSRILTKTITFFIGSLNANLTMEHLHTNRLLLTPKHQVFATEQEEAAHEQQEE